MFKINLNEPALPFSLKFGNEKINPYFWKVPFLAPDALEWFEQHLKNHFLRQRKVNFWNKKNLVFPWELT